MVFMSGFFSGSLSDSTNANTVCRKKRLVSTHLVSHDNKHEQLLPSPPTFKTQQEKEASEGDAIAEKRRGKRKLQDLHGGRG
jgi:hypothetical protein